MSKKKSEPAKKDQVIFETIKGRIKYQGMYLTSDTIRAFFGLAILGKMLQFGVDDNNKTIVIGRVPDKIEAYYGECKRILEKYKHDPEKGFKKIEWVTKFADFVGQKEKKKEEKNKIIIVKELPE